MKRLDKIFWGSVVIFDILHIITWFSPELKLSDTYIGISLILFFFAVGVGIVKFGFTPIFETLKKDQEMANIIQRTDIPDKEKLKMIKEMST